MLITTFSIVSRKYINPTLNNKKELCVYKSEYIKSVYKRLFADIRSFKNFCMTCLYKVHQKRQNESNTFIHETKYHCKYENA